MGVTRRRTGLLLPRMRTRGVVAWSGHYRGSRRWVARCRTLSLVERYVESSDACTGVRRLWHSCVVASPQMSGCTRALTNDWPSRNETWQRAHARSAERNLPQVRVPPQLLRAYGCRRPCAGALAAGIAVLAPTALR